MAHSDAVHITPDHSLKPHTALIAHNHITDNCGIFSKKAVFSEYRAFSFNRENQSHIKGF